MNQGTFAAALLDPEADIPAGLLDPEGRPARARFNVYRNNVTASLLRVLQAAFPVIEKVVGPAYFQALAVEFIRHHPPKTRMMMLYGSEFPGFLNTFPPLAHLPYLPDVARLEQALRQSYHAGDAKPLAPEVLTTLSPRAFLTKRLTFAPSLALIRSAWPVLSIWQANINGTRHDATAAESLVILRKDFDPAPHILTPGMAAVLGGLIGGQPIGQAIECTAREADLKDVLTILLANGAIQDIS